MFGRRGPFEDIKFFSSDIIKTANRIVDDIIVTIKGVVNDDYSSPP